jgi:hypothetical protein
MTHEEIQEIRRRVHRITKGKWDDELGRKGQMPRIDLHAIQADGSKVFLCHFHQVEPKKEVNNNWGPDAEFIANAPEDIRNLLKEIDKLQAEIKTLKGDK